MWNAPYNLIPAQAVVKTMHIPQIAVVNEHRGLHIRWDPSPASDVAYYVVTVSEDFGKTYKELGRTTDTFFLSSPLPKGIYYVRVYAVDANDNWSAPHMELVIRL